MRVSSSTMEETSESESSRERRTLLLLRGGRQADRLSGAVAHCHLRLLGEGDGTAVILFGRILFVKVVVVGLNCLRVSLHDRRGEGKGNDVVFLGPSTLRRRKIPP